ncbi:transglutaminase-like cysteine peptidase [Pelagibius marinus]|uniref:transglutaminase-like cysteine peptidase n=1 Tax=Pelagibius marinus TaxID=2762760 RepID=UPI0018731BB8|nr:transglutaminase-like cysteine peptidase [Pelagibius marinus]
MRALAFVLCLLLPVSAAADPYYPSPPAHSELLARQPELAFTGWDSWPVDLELLDRVNRGVNASMSYRPEVRDVWGAGSDCEDYALGKLTALLKAGVPRGALRLAIARVGGHGHAVLVVRDLWVLDSRHDEPLRLDRSGLRLAAWETAKGKWNPAGGFASLADHLRWAGRQSASWGSVARSEQLYHQPSVRRKQ